MRVEEARAISNRVLEYEEDMTRIFDVIRSVAEEGKFEYAFHDNISNACIISLIDLGYNVDDGVEFDNIVNWYEDDNDKDKRDI